MIRPLRRLHARVVIALWLLPILVAMAMLHRYTS
jgi:hypothetical protein